MAANCFIVFSRNLDDVVIFIDVIYSLFWSIHMKVPAGYNKRRLLAT